MSYFSYQLFMDIQCIIGIHDMVITIDLQCIGTQLWLVWIKLVSSPVWVYLSLPFVSNWKIANYFTYHFLLASYFGGYSIALGNLTLLSSLNENFTLPFYLLESLAWVTLVTFFLDVKGTTLFGVLHKASPMPDPVEKKVLFSLLFRKNPWSAFLIVLLKALVVSKKEKKCF